MLASGFSSQFQSILKLQIFSRVLFATYIFALFELLRYLLNIIVEPLPSKVKSVIFVNSILKLPFSR
ncbi:unknown [Coraliomargarita sp. CAG:312]|nr:unknown [Coraliomargarita sp. CAG:312]